MSDTPETLLEIRQTLTELNDFVRASEFDDSASKKLRSIIEALRDLQDKQERLNSRVAFLCGAVGVATGFSFMSLVMR